MLFQKLDHEPIEQPGLLDLARMARAWQSSQLAIGYALLKRERPLMAVVFAAGQNDCRTGDTLMVAFGIGLRQCLELMNDRLHVGVSIALGKEVCKEVRQRRRAKRRAKIFEGVSPAIIDAIGRVIGDSAFSKFLVRVVTGSAQDQRAGLSRT